jgi:hypothetical protein
MKRDVKTNRKAAAAILGKVGGQSRAKVLTAGQRKDIASQGGKAKAAKYRRK